MDRVNMGLSGVCVSCGAPVPEGRMICPTCEKEITEPVSMVTVTKKRKGIFEKRNF